MRQISLTQGKFAIVDDEDYKHLGVFSSESEAALIYNKAAKEYFGEFARLNEIAA